MVGFGEDPGDRPSDDGTDRSDRGTGRSGTEPSGPPEDDNDDVNPGGRFGAPPEDDNDDAGFEAPSRDGPPEDSGEEGDRVDDVTPSPDPGIDPPTDRAAPEDDFAEKPDRRGPTERQEQEAVAEETPGLSEDDIEQVERIEQPDGRDQLRAELEGPSAEAQFETRRERARREADVDAISRLGGFDSEDLQFSQRDGRTVVQPTDEAVSERRQELADQRVSGTGGSEVRLIETRRRGGQETGITGALGVDSDAEPQGFASRSGGAAQRIRDETIPEPVDAGITLAAQSFRSGRLGELTERGTQAFEPAAERFDAAVEQGGEAAADVTVVGPGGRAVSPTFIRGGAEGAQALNPARFAQDAIRSPEITVRGIEGATGTNAPGNIQTAADVTEAGAELAAEEGPEFVRENPGRTAEIAIGAGGALAAGGVAGTGALRGARAAGRTAARARRVDLDAEDFLSDTRGQRELTIERERRQTVEFEETGPEDVQFRVRDRADTEDIDRRLREAERAIDDPEELRREQARILEREEMPPRDVFDSNQQFQQELDARVARRLDDETDARTSQQADTTTAVETQQTAGFAAPGLAEAVGATAFGTRAATPDADAVAAEATAEPAEAVETVEPALEAADPFGEAVTFEAERTAQPVIEAEGAATQQATAQPEALADLEATRTATREATREATETVYRTPTRTATRTQTRTPRSPELNTDADDEDEFVEDPLAGVRAVEARLAEQGGEDE
jgi:hypothetical protein